MDDFCITTDVLGITTDVLGVILDVLGFVNDVLCLIMDIPCPLMGSLLYGNLARYSLSKISARLGNRTW